MGVGLEEAPGLWGPGPFAVVQGEEDTHSDGPGEADKWLPTPWLVEPSLGEGACLLGHRSLRITTFSSCLFCKNWGLPSCWHVLKAKGFRRSAGVKRE